MSGITPILDTLLHQVLGRRVDTPAAKDQPLPVSAAASSDAIQPSRSDSRLHQQGGDRIAIAPFVTGREGGAASLPLVAGQAGVSSAQLHLSHAATEIADILSRFPATQTVSIRPLISSLVQPGSGADALANVLSQSVRESGLFYESHLLRWMSGQYPRAALMREPQAWLSLTFRPFTPSSLLTNSSLSFWQDTRATSSQNGALGATAPPSNKGTPPDSFTSRASGDGGAVTTERRLQLPSSGNVANEGSTSLARTSEAPSSLSMARAHQLSQPSSDTLQSLVRHQLELIAAPNLRWEGQLWPGIPMTLILTELSDNHVHHNAEDAPGRSGRGEEEGAGDWRAEVQLRMPSLGIVDIVFRTRRDADLQVEVKPVEDTARALIRQELAPLRERLASLAMDVEIALGVAGDE